MTASSSEITTAMTPMAPPGAGSFEQASTRRHTDRYGLVPGDYDEQVVQQRAGTTEVVTSTQIEPAAEPVQVEGATEVGEVDQLSHGAPERHRVAEAIVAAVTAEAPDPSVIENWKQLRTDARAVGLDIELYMAYKHTFNEAEKQAEAKKAADEAELDAWLARYREICLAADARRRKPRP